MRTVAALYRELTADARPDGELLAAFLADPSNGAFAELVRRHGPTVWGACRRLLPDAADAEDAFQAAFLTLVRRARALTRRPSLGPWLHRVAVWTARNARRRNARRLARRAALPDHLTAPAPPDADLRFDLDAALLALPARYREPIVLCHLLGLSRREAAARLGCPEGSLSGWLDRGLALLRARLRGLDPARALAGAAVAVPAALASDAARAAAAGAAAGFVAPTVSTLVEGVLHVMWMKKATAAAFALCATLALGVGLGLGTRTDHTSAGARDGSPGAPPTKSEQLPGDPAVKPAEVTDEIHRLNARLKAAFARQEAASLSAEVAADKTAAERFRKDAEDAAAEARALTAKIYELMAASKRNPKPEPKAADPDRQTLERQIADLQQQLADARARAERSAVEAQTAAEEARVRAAKAETETKLLTAERNVLAKKLDALLRERGALGARLEVYLFGKDAAQPCRVKEVRDDGKLLVSVLVEDEATLGPLFARAARDEHGPKVVFIHTQADTPPSRAWAALEACRNLGFERVTLYDPPVEKPGTTGGYPPPERNFKSKDDFDKYFKKLEDVRPRTP